jgi:hypothetical protein
MLITISNGIVFYEDYQLVTFSDVKMQFLILVAKTQTLILDFKKLKILMPIVFQNKA